MAQSAIEFKTAAQEQCYLRVAEFCRELFGEKCLAHKESPTFGLRDGSAMITITVYPWKRDDAVITVGAWVIREVKMTPALMLYLLRENFKVSGGGFGIDAENDIFFEHSIVGSTCDAAELGNSVAAVGTFADKYDDEIKRLWGGKTARE